MNTTTATAPELNAQLFLQLSNIADNESYLQNYTIQNGETKGGNDLTFAPLAVLDVMKQI